MVTHTTVKATPEEFNKTFYQTSSGNAFRPRHSEAETKRFPLSAPKFPLSNRFSKTYGGRAWRNNSLCTYVERPKNLGL